MKVNGNITIFKVCAQEIGTDSYFIQEAIRFESDGELIYSVSYNDWDDTIVSLPIYKSNSKEDLRKTLVAISKFYTEHPDGVLTIIEGVLYV